MEIPRPKLSEITLLLVLFGLTALTASLRFGTSYPNFPDSEKYLTLVDAFRGEVPLNETVSPFNYRILLPLITAILPVDPAMFMSWTNTILLFVLAFIMYRIPRKFGFGQVSSTIAAAFCMVSWPVMQYGSSVLVETPFMVCLALGIYAILDKWNWKYILIITTVGVLFKETALLIALVYLFYDWKKAIPVGVSGGIAYLGARILMSDSIGSSTWVWNLGETNLVRPYAALDILGYALFLIMIPLFFAILWRKDVKVWCTDFNYLWDTTWVWFIYVGLPLATLIPISYFFAYFSVRFIWPMYLGLLPMIAYGVQRMLVRVYELEIGTEQKIR